MSQDKEREARTIHELPLVERDEAIRAFEAAHGDRFAAGLASDRAWVEGYAHARAALASQQAVQGEPVHPNHRPDLRYILTTLERVTPVVKHQKELREQVQASITGMRYVIERTEAASPPSREPLTDEQLQTLYREFMLYQYGVTPSGLTRIARAIERAHGIHSREGGSNV